MTICYGKQCSCDITYADLPILMGYAIFLKENDLQVLWAEVCNLTGLFELCINNQLQLYYFPCTSFLQYMRYGMPQWEVSLLCKLWLITPIANSSNNDTNSSKDSKLCFQQFNWYCIHTLLNIHKYILFVGHQRSNNRVSENIIWAPLNFQGLTEI